MGSNLSGSRLRYARLSSAKLSSANLSLTDLTYAKFDCANLNEANLSNAVLHYADFAGASLRGANLNGANLYHVKNLTPAQLEDSLGGECTILPPELQSSVSWSRSRTPTRSSTLVWHEPRALAAPAPRHAPRRVASVVLMVGSALVLVVAYTVVPGREHPIVTIAPIPSTEVKDVPLILAGAAALFDRASFDAKRVATASAQDEAVAATLRQNVQATSVQDSTVDANDHAEALFELRARPCRRGPRPAWRHAARRQRAAQLARPCQD